jgi:arabinose-5-phosphate isomerase
VSKPSFSTPEAFGACDDVRVGQRSLRLAAQALEATASGLGTPFERACELLASATGKVVVTGVGKSAHVAAKIAATLNSTGTRAMFLHAGEALHGDVGAVEAGDVVLCLSKSGSSDEVVGLLPTLRSRGCQLVAMTAKADSALGKQANVVLDVSVAEEACRFDLAPTTSTSLQLALGDALAMALMERSGFQPADFAKNHPAGALGKKLTWTLKELVDPARRPAVAWTDDVPTVLQVMSQGRYGATVVWATGSETEVAGIVTDGDLRRALADGNVMGQCAGDLASPTPKTLDASTLATHAAQWMQEQGISQVVVMEEGAYLGMVHLHDCLREGLV